MRQRLSQFIVILLICPAALFAQEAGPGQRDGRVAALIPEPARVGLVLTGGVAMNALRIGPGAGSRTATDAALIAGLALTLPSNRKFAFQPEVLISERTDPTVSSRGLNSSTPYVVVPVLFRASMAEREDLRLSVLMGPEFATRATQSQGLIEERNVDYGIAIGLNAEVGQRFVLDVRYTRGLVTLAPEARADEFVTTRAVAVRWGWRLH